MVVQLSACESSRQLHTLSQFPILVTQNVQPFRLKRETAPKNSSAFIATLCREAVHQGCFLASSSFIADTSEGAAGNALLFVA
jgi:hypothetical protein